MCFALRDRRREDAGDVARLVLGEEQRLAVRHPALVVPLAGDAVDGDELDVGVGLGRIAQRIAEQEADADDDVRAAIGELRDVGGVVRLARRLDVLGLEAGRGRFGGCQHALVGRLVEALVVDATDVGHETDLDLGVAGDGRGRRLDRRRASDGASDAAVDGATDGAAADGEVVAAPGPHAATMMARPANRVRPKRFCMCPPPNLAARGPVWTRPGGPGSEPTASPRSAPMAHRTAWPTSWAYSRDDGSDPASSSIATPATTTPSRWCVGLARPELELLRGHHGRGQRRPAGDDAQRAARADAARPDRHPGRGRAPPAR